MGKYLFALVAVLASTWVHAERKIYSCKDADGNAVFSPEPCGKDAKEVPYDTGSVARTTQAETEAPPAQESVTDAAKKVPKKAHRAPKGSVPSDAIQDIADMNADNHCRRDAKSRLVYQNDVNIQQYESRKVELERQGSYARNNQAGATYLNGIRQEIGQLNIAITQERSRITQENARVDSAYRSSIVDCDKTKADRAAARPN